MTNSAHTLQPYLPERHELTYNLRDRSHNRTLITKTMDLTDRDFLIYIFIRQESSKYKQTQNSRMLYKFSY